MKNLGLTMALIALLSTGQALATERGCSIDMVKGRWVFATGIGHQALEGAPPPADITAIGTWNVHSDGTLEGIFDVTFQDAAFVPGIPYTGSVIVNPDCTGTVTFTTGAGSARTDSILVLNRYEIWGMSQDPKNLWTYKVRRLPGRLYH